MSPRALSILHVCPRPAFSGLEAYALSMAKGQRDLGHSVKMVVLKNSPLSTACKKADLKTFEFEKTWSQRASFTLRLTKLLRAQTRPHVLHLHSTQDLDLVLPALIANRAQNERTQVILQTHIWISHSKRDPLHAISYSFIDEVWCSSQPARETLEKFLPISKSKIRVVNYGRAIQEIEQGFLSRKEARQKLQLPMDAIVVASVARIDEGKGTRELLEAALECMKTRANLHLILIGPATADDPKAVAYAERIQAQIASLPEPRRVHAPGAIAESYRYLKAFDLFALPTYKECFALSLLEAMLAGLPCLATNSGGSPEVVREGETGWLFEPRSVTSLQSTLERALTSPGVWTTYGATAKARVQRDFDFALILPGIIDSYRELLRG